nr:hypothetical protein GCM10020093_108610 [Planobispora longispora]
MFRSLLRRSRRPGRSGAFGSGELLLFGTFLAVAAVAVVLVTPSGGLPAASEGGTPRAGSPPRTAR